MKKLNKKKLYVSISIGLLVVFVCFFGLTTLTEDRLTETQIEALREQYPICGRIVPALASISKSSLEDVKGRVESFVYGEVVGDISTYYVNASTGTIELDEKRQKHGINDVFEFYEYTISVISDTEGKYESGELITIAANSDMKNYNPKLTDGMKVVVPVTEDDKVDNRNYYNVVGTFYVTDDGYAISAFDEEPAKLRRSLSGIKVEELMKELKK